MTEEATTPVAEDDTPSTPNEVADADQRDTASDDTQAEGVEGEEPGDQTEGEGDDDLEEVEWEGKKARIPAEFKAALLRHADYTQKTQTLSEQRRQVEARDHELAARAEALNATVEERAELKATEKQLAAFDQLSEDDWDTLEEEDPKQFRKLQRQRQSLKDRAGELKGALQTKEREALAADRTQFETRVQESQAVLARDIKGWGPEVARQITAVGKDLGYSNDELIRGNADARFIKGLHEIMLGRAALKREAAAKRVQSAQQTKPERTVGGGSPHQRRTTDASGDGLSTAEWMRREDARLAEKRKRA